MITNAAGARLDKAPTTLTKDPDSLDGAVVNGFSCMNCHFPSVVDKRDQIRNSVVNNVAVFNQATRDKVSLLYPVAADFTRATTLEVDKVTLALKQAGVTTTGKSPVLPTFKKWFGAMTINQAAAELGVEVATLRGLLARSAVIGQAFGSLSVDGGTLQRETFEANFAEAVRQLVDGRVVNGAP